jgi:UDP-N-acetylglucosamine/UDP-N-acetylgalactosamine diphosphorylase
MPAPSIHFVCQGVLPALNSKGQFMLTAADKLFANPDGHGGVYRAVKRNRVLEQLRHKNIDLIYYCQVDNPLVFMADPTFIGHHLNSEAQMSVKVVEKTDPAEKVGLVVENSDKIQCVEYSDLSAEIQEQTDSDGGLLLRAGNIAVHCYSLDFFEEMAEAHLPLHLAHKKIKALPPGENVVTDVDAVKFETFVFDALPLADRAMVQLADREFEFAPVKNRDGSDSAATSREALSARAKSWLRQIGCDCSASDNALIELSSTIASGPQDLSFRKKQLQTNPQLLVCSCGNKLISLA